MLIAKQVFLIHIKHTAYSRWFPAHFFIKVWEEREARHFPTLSYYQQDLAPECDEMCEGEAVLHGETVDGANQRLTQVQLVDLACKHMS